MKITLLVRKAGQRGFVNAADDQVCSNILIVVLMPAIFSYAHFSLIFELDVFSCCVYFFTCLLCIVRVY